MASMPTKNLSLTKMETTPAGKIHAVVAYLTFLGWIIAYFLNRDAKNKFATYHIKNMFGLLLILFVAQIMQTQHLLFGEVLWLLAFVLWVISLVMALTNKQKGIPFLSEKFQQWFTFLE